MSTMLSSHVVVCVQSQSLLCFSDDRCILRIRCSTALNGCGQKINSFQTPLGRHKVVAVAGINAPIETVFKARIPQPSVLPYDDHDPIVGRVFWLSGLEEGKNLGGDYDTKSRRIYIHGTSKISQLGEACSLGCIRIHPNDALRLETMIGLGTPIDIVRSFNH